MPVANPNLVNVGLKRLQRQIEMAVMQAVQQGLLDIEGEAKQRAPVRRIFRTHKKALGGIRIGAAQVERGFVSNDQRRRATLALRSVQDANGNQRFNDADIEDFVNRNARSYDPLSPDSRELTTKGRLSNPVFEFFLNAEGRRQSRQLRSGQSSASLSRTQVENQQGKLVRTKAQAQIGGTLRRGVVAGTAKKRGSVIRGSVISTAPYSVHVEFGTRQHGRAQPFLRPAYEAEADKFLSRLRGQLQKVR